MRGVMRRLAVCWILVLGVCACVHAQRVYRGRVVDEDHRPIADVSVLIYRSETSVAAFGFSDADGQFAVRCPDKVQPVGIGFRMMGFEDKRISPGDFADGQTVILHSKAFLLKEVNVRPDRIRQRNDTLVYNVLSFKQDQDRSIADVIAKMPGLEVSSSGQISFEGKSINKFYIEGMDLMGSKYAQASENLSADMVSSVQVLQNHQPVKTLRGVQFSDQAALNLVLKDNVKNAWAGLLEAGVGSTAQDGASCLYSGRLLGMMFGRKQQNLSMYKADNTGKDITREVTDLITGTRDNQEERGLLGELVTPAAEIGGQRTSFNRSHLVATNHLLKVGQDDDLRVQLDYLWAEKEGYTAHTTEYLDLDGILLAEENRVESADSRLKGDVTYKINRDKLYLNNRFHGSWDLNKGRGEAVLNGEPTRQDVRVRKGYLTEDFELISRLRNGNSLEFSSQSTFSYLPGRLAIVTGGTEQLDVSAFETNNYAAFSHKVRGYTLSHRVGYSWKTQQLKADYQDMSAEEQYDRHNLYVASSLHLVKKSLKVNATLRANALLRYYEGNSGFHFSLQPNLHIQYDFSGTTAASLRYSYRESDLSLMSLYRTPIFTSYYTQSSHTGDFEDRGIHMLTGSWQYQHPIKGLFLNLAASWTRRTNEVLYQSTYEEPVFRRSPTAHRYKTDSYLLHGNAAYSCYWGKTLISLGGRQLWSNYYLWQQGVRVPWQMRDTEITGKLSMQPVRVFSYELQSRLQLNRQVCRENHALSGEGIRTFAHALSLFLFPLKKLEIGVKGEVYHSSDPSVAANVFADAHVSYQLKRWEWRLTCTNFMGNHRYERRMRTSLTDVYSVYRLRPREVLLSFTVEL